MSWNINVTADKTLLVTGEYPSESLLGEKDIFPLSGSADKQKGLFGDTIVSFTSDSDKIVSLLGSVGVSLTGQKLLPTYLLGKKDTTVALLGEAPRSFFRIHVDTTYITCDDVSVTCDRD